MDFTKLTVVKLKKELARRGAKASGRKLDFIQWLETYVQNHDFRGQAIEIPDVNPMPDWPDVSEFHSLALDMMYLAPKKENLLHYVLYRQGNDKLPNEDWNSISKGLRMKEENCVQALSLFKRNDQVNTFFIGLVAAEMKKLNYEIQFILSNRGEVMNSKFECPAGAPPHATC